MRRSRLLVFGECLIVFLLLAVKRSGSGDVNVRLMLMLCSSYSVDELPNAELID
jgi:hypothetical protein